ncbi:uncharacterized protein LOC119070988 [Bradysia coprophila]|uniref:uncharacterized protein LOC119070988 n=1 Tax=Bradysia coprophila TaxID=38358 RepID=UPI00187DD00F|nr:uncharacterized protein LOC119070988 [Bradysia coprophila]
MAVNVPSWVNKEFFTTVIRHHTADDKAEVSNFDVKTNAKPGENFVSLILRAEINYTTSIQGAGSLSVVIKLPPTSGIESEFCETSPIYVTEQDMYDGPLHDIDNLLASVGDSAKTHPKLIYQQTEPHRAIVMEDLGAQGYVRITQPLPNYEDSKRVFQRLAKYHAAGFFLIKQKSADLSRFKASMFHMEDSMIRETFLNEPFVVLCDVLTSWGGMDEYVERLRRFREKFIAMGQRLYEPDPNGYNVLNHGDFHIKNLLFKLNGETIEDFFFLDYQVSVVASPCVDLFYALYNMISDENRRARRSEIIHDYYVEFSNTLKSLQFTGNIPSLHDLQMELLRHGQMEVVKCVCFQIFFLLDTAKLSEYLTTGDSKALKAKLFNEPRFKDFINAELPRLVHLGLL